MPVVAGVAVGLCAPISPLWFWGAGAGLLLPLFLWVKRSRSRFPMLLAAFFLMAAHAGLSTGGRSATSLPATLARPMEYVRFVAVALEDAVPRLAQAGQAEGAVFHARVEGLNRDGEWRRVDDRIRVVLRGGNPDQRLPRYGERWRLHGIVRPAVPRRTGLLTLPQNQAVVDSDRAVFLDAGRGNPLKAWCMRQRRACRAILGRGLDDFPEQRGLLQALLLGYREDLPALLRKDFAATGTVHIFAISGAHVGMMTLLFAGLLRALGVPLTRWFLFLTPVLVVYTVGTGAATSAVRAGVMATLMLAAPGLERRPDAISALAVAAIAILVWSPAQLGDLGFLLSFTAVAGLLAVQPVIEAWVRRVARRHPWQLPGAEASAGSRFFPAALSVVRYGSVSASAWVSTTPLTALFFNLFSPVALAMNLLVIPAAFVILLAGVLSLLCAPLGGPLSEIFNHAARAVASFLTLCIQWAANVPGGHWFVRTPPVAGVLAWYGILAVAAILARRIRGALPVGVALLAGMALAWGVYDARRCRISVLDVGEGSAVLVQAQAARMLVDAGPKYRAEDVLRQLRREGVNRLDALILTHSDAQHVGGALFLMAAIPVTEIWVPARTWPSPALRNILQEAEARAIPVRRLQAGDRGAWPGTLVWEVLWPPASVEMACADDAALVLRVARFGVSLLLAGDAGAKVEQALLAQGTSLAAALLLVGQHGDAGASSAAWLEAVRPQEALISAAPHSDGRHPDEATLDRLRERDIRIWRTDRQGTLAMDWVGSPARWPDPGYRLRSAASGF